MMPGELLIDDCVRSDKRFALRVWSHKGEWVPLYSTDELANIVKVRLLAEYARNLGLSFHPDTRAEEYEAYDGQPYFSKEGAEEYEACMANVPCDPYEVSLKVWDAMGYQCVAIEGDAK